MSASDPRDRTGPFGSPLEEMRLCKTREGYDPDRPEVPLDEGWRTFEATSDAL